MNLAVVNEAVTGMNGVEHEFTEEEKNFVVQFAFRSGSKEDTISLIEALAHSTDKVQSEEIMVTYRSKYDIKPAWVEQVENLLVALEMYRIEEEKAISHLYSYIFEVRESTEKILERFSYDELKWKIPDERKGYLKSLNVVNCDEKAIWLIDYWCNKDICGLIQMPFSRHWIMHTEACLRIKNKIHS